MTDLIFNGEGEFLDFSRFTKHTIWVDNGTWPSVEHYFQASKFQDWKIKGRFHQNFFLYPEEAAKLAEDNKDSIRNDWTKIEANCMEKALYAKFTQYHELKVKLMKTVGKRLLFSSLDHHWSFANGAGENMYGDLLMKVRNRIQQISNRIELPLPPWLVFPGVDPHDMFWRMGLGESYMLAWSKVYLGIGKPSSYQNEFPAPKDWSGFYDD